MRPLQRNRSSMRQRTFSASEYTDEILYTAMRMTAWQSLNGDGQLDGGRLGLAVGNVNRELALLERDAASHSLSLGDCMGEQQ